jgi:1,2-diacylglycerol 3-alpha-glucosyltransferase
MATKTSSFAEYGFRAGGPSVEHFPRESRRSRMRNVDSRSSSRRLRIAFVCDTIAGRLGGGVVAARNVVDALRNDHRVIVAAVDASSDGDLRLPGFQLPLRSMREMQFTMARPDRASLARLFREVDVVHVQFPFWLGAVAVDEARRAGRPVVAAFHVQPENVLANLGLRSPWLSRRIYAYWIASVFGRADAALCPTPFAERKLREHGLLAPVYVVSNGVPPDLGRSLLRRERDDEDFLILAVGRFAREKRQDVIIEAVRRSRHRNRIRLVLAGGGPEEDRLRALGRALPNAPEIGFLSRQQLASHLANADLFVHASEVELEGIAVLEAMHAGLPVLVAEASESAASAFAASDEFRFPSGDAEILAKRIDALIERPDVLAAARGKYQALHHRRPAFSEGIERLVGVYQTLLGFDARLERTNERSARLLT